MKEKLNFLLKIKKKENNQKSSFITIGDNKNFLKEIKNTYKDDQSINFYESNFSEINQGSSIYLIVYLEKTTKLELFEVRDKLEILDNKLSGIIVLT